MQPTEAPKKQNMFKKFMGKTGSALGVELKATPGIPTIPDVATKPGIENSFTGAVPVAATSIDMGALGERSAQANPVDSDPNGLEPRGREVSPVTPQAPLNEPEVSSQPVFEVQPSGEASSEQDSNQGTGPAHQEPSPVASTAPEVSPVIPVTPTNPQPEVSPFSNPELVVSVPVATVQPASEPTPQESPGQVNPLETAATVNPLEPSAESPTNPTSEGEEDVPEDVIVTQLINDNPERFIHDGVVDFTAVKQAKEQYQINNNPKAQAVIKQLHGIGVKDPEVISKVVKPLLEVA